MNNKKLKSIAFLDFIIMILSLSIINLFIYNHYERVDFTQNKLYTISDGTKKILNTLKDNININVYFSKDLPSYMQNITRDVKDMLDEFSAASNGKINIKYIDPETDKETENKVRSLGIPKIQMNVFDKEKTEIKTGYIGIAVLYQDKHEALPVIQDISNFEYDLTMAIKKVQQKEKVKIGYMNLKGSPILQNPRPNQYGMQQQNNKSRLDLFKKVISKDYQLKIFNQNSKTLIPKDIKALIIDSPDKLTNRDMFVIDQYVLNGGNLIVFDNSFKRNGIRGQNKRSNINRLLTQYGINIESGVVVDQYSKRASFGNGMYQVYTRYPFFVSIIPNRLNVDIPITSKIETISLPWCSPIKIVNNKNIDTKVLAYSSNKSTRIDNGYLDFNPRQNFQFTQDSIPLVTLSKGKFNSLYSRYVPFDSTDKNEITPIKKSKATSSVLVVGSAEIVNNSFIQRFKENVVFVLNSVDYMCQENSLINIRSKKIIQRPIKEISSNMKKVIKFFNILFIPILIIVFGLIYNKRRKKGIKLEEEV